MSNSHKGWIGVDLDGTLAEYHDERDWNHVGRPIPAMVGRVKAWLALGIEVRIVTARAAYYEPPRAIEVVDEWIQKHIGQRLEIVNGKDFNMLELWDDRAIQVERNTGKRLI